MSLMYTILFKIKNCKQKINAVLVISKKSLFKNYRLLFIQNNRNQLHLKRNYTYEVQRKISAHTYFILYSNTVFGNIRQT